MAAIARARIPLEIQILVQPQAAYRAAALRPRASSGWLYLHGPLFIALIFGACLALTVSARLTVELVVSAGLCWTFVPFAELFALLLVSRRDSATLSRSQRVDLFFVGHTPWLVWLAGLGLMSAFMPMISFLRIQMLWTIGGGVAALVWSLWIDFHYFREVEQLSVGAAVRSLAVQRIVSWTLIIAVFSYGSLRPSILEVVAS